MAVKLIIGNKLNINDFLYDFNLNKNNNNVITDISIAIGKKEKILYYFIIDKC